MIEEKISQFDAAVRQLNTAVKLFFEGKDLLSVCTLAAAADRIFEDIYRHERNEHLQRQLIQNKDNPDYRLRFSVYEEFKFRIKDEYHKEFFRDYYRKHPNALKHADKNYGEQIEISFDIVEMYVFRAIVNHSIVATNGTVPITSFNIWFMVRHPRFVREDVQGPAPLEGALNYFQEYFSAYGQERARLHCYDMLKLSCPEMFVASDLRCYETINDVDGQVLSSRKRIA